MNTKHKEVLMKYLQLLLYARAASLILSLIGYLPALGNLTNGLTSMISIGVILCLFQLNTANGRYGKAAVTRMIGIMVSMLVSAANMVSMFWTKKMLLSPEVSGIMMYVSLGLTIVATWFEYRGHSETAAENEKLSKSWRILFVCNMVYSLGSSGLSFAMTHFVTAQNIDTELVNAISIVTRLGSKLFSAICVWFLYRTICIVQKWED